jgi:hypothetical protein
MTFLAKYGITLQELVHQACEADVMEDPFGSDEAWGQISAAVSELVLRQGSMLERVTHGHSSGDAIVMGPGHELADGAGMENVRELIKVLASGSLGLIYLDAEPGRRTLEQINDTYPHLIPRLVKHRGVGFILVQSEQDGPLAIGASGVHHLESGRIEGVDPLLPFGPNAARHVLRTNGFPHVADIMVNASFDEQTHEIGAFEELVGSHGGMGGEQMHPFILFPAEFPWPDEAVVSAEHLHRVLIGWLHDLGHDIAREKHLERLAAEADE